MVDLKSKLYSFMEDGIVIIVMLFVFLPVRLFFTSYVSTWWFGSFGVISAIVVVLVILSKKNKLGFFGRMYWKTITRVHKGKRRIISYLTVSFMLYFWTASIYGIHYADSNESVIALKVDAQRSMSENDKQSLQRLEKAVENNDIVATHKELTDQYKKMPDWFIFLAIPILLALPMINFSVWSVLASTLNDFTLGWFLHFATVFFVESLEVAALMFYTYLVTHRTKS
jgi:hypothetical protein